MEDEDSVDAIEAFRTELGPDLDYLADDLAPAVIRLASGIVASRVGDAVRPFVAQSQALTAREQENETATTMRAFEEQHADWKDHEPAMLKLAERIRPSGMTENEYLDHLYETVTRQARTAESHASAHRAASRPRPPSAVPTFEEAAEAAKRGERWE